VGPHGYPQCVPASRGRTGHRVGSNTLPQPFFLLAQSVSSAGKRGNNSGHSTGQQSFPSLPPWGQQLGDTGGVPWPRRGGKAGKERAVPAAWPMRLRVLQPALWALRFGFPSLDSFPLPRQAPGLPTDLKGKSGLRGTAAGTGRGKHGAGAGQAVGDGGEVMP